MLFGNWKNRNRRNLRTVERLKKEIEGYLERLARIEALATYELEKMEAADRRMVEKLKAMDVAGKGN